MAKNSLLFAFRNWKEKIRTADFWIVQLCTIMFFSINFYSSSQLLYKSGGTIGLFALFPIMLMSIDFTLIIFSGYLMLTSDIPVSREDNLFIIIRSDRLTWFVSQFLYGFFLALTHMVLVFFYSFLFYIRNVSFSPDWGEAILDGSAFMSGYMLFDEKVLAYNPVHLTVCLFVLSVLLCVFFSMLCCIFSMRFANGVGVALCACFIIMERFVSGYDINIGYFSPVGMLKNFYVSQGRGFLSAICYFVVLIFLLGTVGIKYLYRADIR